MGLFSRDVPIHFSPEPALLGEVIEGNLCFVIDVEVGDLLLVLEDPRSPTRHRVFLATE